MNLALTSDFPSTGNQSVLDLIKNTTLYPKIAWIPPFTAIGRERFPAALALFKSYGCPDVEYCDIDEDPDERQLARLADFDVLYLTGGDPIGFRRNILRVGLSVALQDRLDSGRLIVAASGGSMQFTKNVSLFRLLTAEVDEVLASYGEYTGLDVVGYEMLPHLNRCPPSFLETVGRYSERVAHDVIALSDGAALLHAGGGDYRCVGQAARFRSGAMTPIDGAE